MKKKLGIIVLILSCFFIARAIFDDAGQFITSIKSIRIEYLIPSIFFYFLYFYFRALSWGFIVEALGKKVKTPDKQSLPPSEIKMGIWFLSESTRYIPGKVWSFIARVQMAKEKGVTTKLGIASLVVEILLALSVAVALSYTVLFSYLNRLDTPLIWLSLLVLVVMSAMVTLLPKLREKFSSKIKELKTIKLAYREFCIAVLFQIFAWISFGLGVYFLSINIVQGLNPLNIISIAVFSWLVGYLSIVTPTGLGIREGMMVVLLGQFMSLGQAAMVALIARFVIILVEAVNILYWLFKRERSKLALIPSFLQHNWSYILLALFIAVYVITFSVLSILRHNAFASNFDLANMSQTVWNTLHGRPFALSGASDTISRFSIHADLILILLSPFYLVWEKARMLLILQSLFLGLGAIPVYFLAQKILNRKVISLALVLVYLLNPGMQWTNIYDFHGVSLAIPFLLSAFYFAYTKNWKWYWLFVILAITTKEQISLYISMLGLAIFFVFKERKVGLISFILGGLWFLTTVFIVMPYFSPTGEHWALNWYKSPDTNTGTLTLIPTVETIIHKFTTANDIGGYYLSLLKPFGFLPLLGLPWLLLSLPELTINVLSSQAQMRSTVFHYDSGITPSLVIATIFGLSYIKKLLQILKPVSKFANIGIYIIVAGLLAVSLRVNYHYSPLPTTPSCWCLVYQVSEEDRQFDKVLQTILSDAIVTSSGEIRAHLTQREHSFTLPNATESAHYIAILDESRIIGDYQPKEFETKLIKVLNESEEHELVEHIGHFYLFKRKDYQPK